MDIPIDERFKDLTGLKFGKLTVIEYDGFIRSKGKGKKRFLWKCQCECGNQKSIKGCFMLRGKVNSCGCLWLPAIKKAKTKHGRSRNEDGMFNIWNLMKGRCYNTKDTSYKNYGGRGITVCERWLESFENFYEDMGDRPSKKYSIERKDNNGNYCPENCKWATQKEQNNNQRTNINITYKNKTQTIGQWSEETGLSRFIITKRFKAGWTSEEIFLTPIILKGINLCRTTPT